jgi:AcrR family transcriptional regulator
MSARTGSSRRRTRARPRPATVPRHSPAAPRWRRRKEARPAELLEAALEVFVERGYAAANLDDVARRAGVTKGTLYRYYEGKEELLKAVVRQSLVQRLEEAEQDVARYQGPSSQLLAQLVRRWWQAVGATPAAGIPKLMIAEAANFPELARFYYREVIQRGFALGERVLRRGIERGEFRAVEVRAAVRLVIAPLLVAALWQRSFSRFEAEALDPTALIEQHIEFYLRAVAAPGAPGGAP